ncbi:MAG TPA: DUF433 domain-containing protein [Bacteroidetes bacterium]|nr:DUF433 domain-containing protein [Bacteroidota bacterium]
MSIALDSRITHNPKIKGGKPCIAGRRISVQDIVIWHERLGKGIDEIAAEYDLSISDIYIALGFYYMNRKIIDRSIKEDKIFVEALRKNTPSVLQAKLKSLGDSN